MNKLYWVMAIALLSTATPGLAESIRTLFVKENRMPELHQFEVGAQYDYQQFKEPDTFSSTDNKMRLNTIGPYARFGLLPDITVYGRAPYGIKKSDVYDSANGFRDLAVGVELLAYEYTYKYPWIIPYVEVTFPTGDKDEGLGLGEADGIFGVAVGTTTYDVLNWVLDGRYDSNVGDNGRFEGAAAIIWDISDKFAVLSEAKITEKAKNAAKDDVPLFLNGGMAYRPLENLTISWYGGYAFNTETTAGVEEEGRASAKIAYSF